jgi:hypothetical protein
MNGELMEFVDAEGTPLGRRLAYGEDEHTLQGCFVKKGNRRLLHNGGRHQAVSGGKAIVRNADVSAL